MTTPPAPTHRIITSEELSEFQQHQVEQLEIPNSAFTTSKLVADLNPKLNYVCHYRNIKRFLQLGLKITKVCTFLYSAFNIKLTLIYK